MLMTSLIVVVVLFVPLIFSTGSNAVIHGDIICKSIEIEPHAILIGQLNVSMKSVITSSYTRSKPTDPPTVIEPEEEGDDNSDPNSPYKSPKKTEHQDNDDEECDPETKEDDIPVPPRRAYKNILYIHEPQVDFYVGGSAQVGEKAAEFIENNLESIDEIYVTLDSHLVCFVSNVMCIPLHVYLLNSFIC